MRRIKIYKYMLYFLIIVAIIIFLLVLIKHVQMLKNEKKLKQTIKQIQISNDDNNCDELNTAIDGNKVIGTIRIPKINIEYPILETTNEETLKISITKFWGEGINQNGNLTLAGHNNLNGTMFGKVKQLVCGDIIELMDAKKVTLNYEIYKMDVIDPNDISCIASIEKEIKEVTLITCTNGHKNRYIIKAKEIL